MRKKHDLIIGAIPVFLILAVIIFLIFDTENADASSWDLNKIEVDREKATLVNEIEELDSTISSIQEEEKKNESINKRISLEMEKNKLVAYSEAYQLAIEIEEGDSISSPSISSIPFISSSPGAAVPPEFMPYYKAAGERYGVDWSVLAAIHKIETSFSSIKTMVSSVGAIGHMQFMPPTWKYYGVDGNNDGIISAWDIQDSIFSAANYLSASGYSKDKRKAIWHYNHAEWYVNDVIETAKSFEAK